MGGGHYTAFARSFHNNKWYEFDDSCVSEISDENAKDRIVTDMAYNLFFRRRDWHEANKQNGCDFDAMAQKPDMAMLPADKK